MNSDHTSALFGRMDLESLDFLKVFLHPFDTNLLILSGAAWVVILGGIFVVAVMTYMKWWKPLFLDWLISVDHKKIGVMYIVLAFIMLLRGVIEGVVMRAQQADGLHGGFLSADHYAQLFSTHGTIMIFFMLMPFLTGLMNVAVPLQIGARDVSFPMLNSVSLGLTIGGAVLVMVSLVLGEFTTGGWTAYPPYTGSAFQPGVGPDYWIWSVTLSGIGATLTGMNFVVTIYKERAPGMTFFRMPMFTWTALCTAILMVFAMPPLTVASAMLLLDRYADFHFFTNDLGGNMMNYANLFWLFGHPEVYILVLPAFGVFSEVTATFSGKRLYGYGSLVVATMAIAVLSFTVWLHHFFTMGQDSNVNAAFGIATMLIGIPTGVKIYDWMATMYRGRVRFTVAMLWTINFMVLFVLGGLSGIILANPSIDFQTHNTLFLVAHFHNVLIPGVFFGMMAGYNYWFPKLFGFRLNDFWGYVSVWGWTIGFMLVFFPLYVVGLEGMTRRTVSYTDPAYLPWMLLSGLGAIIVTIGLIGIVMQLYVSIRDKEKTLDIGGDPWDARTLEWATPSPVPAYNFPVIPHIHAREAFAVAKEAGAGYQQPTKYTDIHLPGNTWMGVVMMVFGTGFAFAMIWYMWWLAILCLAIVVVSFVGRAIRGDRHPHIVKAADIEREHNAWLEKVRTITPVNREQELKQANLGVAAPEYMEAAQ
ncbi:cbb3-type cytochrome c oxidase subunit I [Acidimangrovimonas sediminis]|uniref:cbb3-type cytochrome c oxidase subunit I n=1 Tax=Acidimangrovimonas sediminis TaxID=2056283 RepID=UPI000C7F88C5|nr:cbb3-type cytochrome c oxidase subunit I [Acidimangrovimonas sediminis]